VLLRCIILHNIKMIIMINGSSKCYRLQETTVWPSYGNKHGVEINFFLICWLPDAIVCHEYLARAI